MSLQASVLAENLQIALKELKGLDENDFILLSDNDGQLNIYAPLHTPQRVTLGARIETSGNMFVHYKTFAKYIEWCYSRIDLDWNKKVHALILMNEFSLATFKCEPQYDDEMANNWLNEYSKVHTPLMTMLSSTFKQVASEVVKFASKEDNRPVLTGVLFKVIDNQLTLVSANGYALSKGVIDDLTVYPSDTLEFIIPADVVKNVLKIIPKEVTDLTITTNGLTYGFSIDDNQVLANPIGGTFPDYERIIPNIDNAVGIATVYANSLGWGLLQAGAMIKGDNECLKLITKPSVDWNVGTLNIASLNPEVGDTDGMIDCSFNNGAIGGEYYFTLDYLKAAVYPAPKKPPKPKKKGDIWGKNGNYQNTLYFFGDGEPFIVDNGITITVIMPRRDSW